MRYSSNLPRALPRAAFLTLLATLLWASTGGVVLARTAPAAQDVAGYLKPPQEVVDLITAPPVPDTSLSPDGLWCLFEERGALPTIAEVSRPMLRLAGLRIDPVAETRFTTRFGRKLSLRATDGVSMHEVELPDGARILSTSWAPSSERFLVVLAGEGGAELWGGHVEDEGVVRRMTKRLSTVMGRPSWLADSTRVLCHLVPAQRGASPPAPTAPSGPNVQECDGISSPLRTFQDLLKSPHDGALFEHHARTELALIEVQDGTVQVLGQGLLHSVQISPDGTHLLETELQKPFSFLHTYRSFPAVVSVRPLAGGEPVVLADVPLEQGVPIGGVREGRRQFAWKPNEPCTVVWVQALDGGDPRRDVPHRDRWMELAAPFEAAPTQLVRVEQRARGLEFLADARYLITSEYDRDRRWTRSLLHDLQSAASPRVLEDRSIRDRYGDPGDLVRHIGPLGRRIVRRDGDYLYRVGAGSSPDGSRPFLDRVAFDTLASERVWRCAPGAFESIVHVAPRDGDAPLSFVTRHESPSSPPNLRLRREGDEGATALTDFADPTPQIRGIKKRLVTYEREDGVPLSATLYLPAGHEPGQRLPLFVWAYPIEYNNSSTAGQVGGSPYRFTRISGASHLVLLTQGYAIMDGATVPIIGDAETMNDTFRQQLVAGAKAAIEHAVELDVADPQRVAVGGHSYGAFMTANLLAHSDLFRAGVARSGAYNRSLTPFGFQSERRSFWEAPETYFAVSPFMHAHRIDEPLLLIHGEADNNSGTFPLQSQRMYHALQGNGGVARLVMLPSESHGYRAAESLLHVHAETIRWLDRHVKGLGRRKPPQDGPPDGRQPPSRGESGDG